MDTPAKKVWGGCSTPANTPTSFQDIQSEHLAMHITQSPLEQAMPAGEDVMQAIRKMEELEVQKNRELLQESLQTEENSDYLLASTLQRQFDREHDALLQSEENHYNKQSKVKLCYDNYKSSPGVLCDSSEDEIEDMKSDDSDYEANDCRIKFNKSGTSGKGANMISKHDIKLCNKLNSNRVLDNFSTAVDTGDSTNISMSNRVYNQLKCHSISETKRSKRLHERKEHSTAESAVDEKTRLIIFKMVNNHVLESVDGIISTGKEAAVLSAVGGTEHIKSKDGKDLGPIPKQCVVKIFKTSLIDFKNRGEYIKGDQRFFKDEFKKQNPRKILRIWAEKEAANLNSLRRHGVPCPVVVTCKKHILVMSMIVDRDPTTFDHSAADPSAADPSAVDPSSADPSTVDPAAVDPSAADHYLGSPARKIKECNLDNKQYSSAYQQCVKHIHTMYTRCHLVHADLSEYNLLWDNHSLLYVIDVGQAVDSCHPGAMRFLLRDCQNITKFFRDAGVEEVECCYKLFNYVTGKSLKGEGEHFLAQIESYEKNEISLREQKGNKEYSFDYFYDKARQQNTDDNNRNHGNPEDSDQSDSSQLENRQKNGDLDIDNI